MDRLWHENLGVFTPNQRKSLNTVTLARIICDNTGISSVPQIPFRFVSATNSLVRCSRFPRVNLSPWRERRGEGPDEAMTGEEPESGQRLTFTLEKPLACTFY